MRFDRLNLPPTPIVNAAIKHLALLAELEAPPSRPGPVMAAADELARLLAHCLVRDEMDRADAAEAHDA